MSTKFKFVFNIHGVTGAVQATSVQDAKRLATLHWAKTQLPPGLATASYVRHAKEKLSHYNAWQMKLECLEASKEVLAELTKRIQEGVQEEGKTMHIENKLHAQLTRINKDLKKL